jgi:predicted nuclease of predicted toxin-antitoxin system
VPARLKVDENLPDEIAELLSDHGHDAVTVADQGWEGLADNELWRRIQAEGRWIVTADKEFADFRYRPPGTHSGIILMRADPEGLDQYLLLARMAVDSLNLEELTGAVIVVTNRGVRTRRAP